MFRPRNSCLGVGVTPADARSQRQFPGPGPGRPGVDRAWCIYRTAAGGLVAVEMLLCVAVEFPNRSPSSRSTHRNTGSKSQRLQTSEKLLSYHGKETSAGRREPYFSAGSNNPCNFSTPTTSGRANRRPETIAAGGRRRNHPGGTRDARTKSHHHIGGGGAGTCAAIRPRHSQPGRLPGQKPERQRQTYVHTHERTLALAAGNETSPQTLE